MFSGFSSTTTAQQQPQQQQQQSGSLFGGSVNQPSTTNASSFGGATGGGPLFGNTAGTSGQQSGGGLFGNQSSTAQPTTQGTGNTGLFGSSTIQPTAGLFGSSTNQPPAGSLFGGAATQQPATGTGTNPSGGNTLWGNTSTTQGTGSGGGGLFGNTTGGGIFGQSQTANQPSNAPAQINPPSLFGGGGFGQTQQNQQQNQQQQQQQQPATTSFFGQPQQSQQPQGSLFGGFGQSTLKPATGGSMFGGSTGGPSLGLSGLGAPSNNLFASKTSTVPAQQQQADAQSQFANLAQRIEGIALAWNSNSPQCRFQHYFYNLVDPSQVHMYGRPPNATNDALWQKALRENPDPNCLVPALAVGFDDLQKRVEAQAQQATAHQEKIKELKTRVEALAKHHELSNSSRIHRAATLHAQLTHRILKLVQHLHLLIPALRSSSIRPEEEALRAALEAIDEEVRRPGGLGRMRGKLNELWAIVGAINAANERGRKTRSDGAVQWAVVDEEGLAQIAQILSEQQTGLAHLTKILQRDLKDLRVVEGTSGSVESDMSSTLVSSVGLSNSSVYQ